MNYNFNINTLTEPQKNALFAINNAHYKAADSVKAAVEFNLSFHVIISLMLSFTS